MNNESSNIVSDLSDLNIIKHAVIHRLNELCDKFEGSDKNRIRDAIDALENPNNERDDGGLWLILFFLVLFGFKFDGNSWLYSLNDLINNRKGMEEETKQSMSCCDISRDDLCGFPVSQDEVNDAPITCCCGGPVIEDDHQDSN